jgi:predicted DNA-binding transcriptional regulator YafY
MIYELLHVGEGNATTAAELAGVCHCTTRDITRQIEKERRDGLPICATCSNGGYYLPEDAEDLERYCDRLKHRSIEIFKTRQALVRTLERIRDRKEDKE